MRNALFSLFWQKMVELFSEADSAEDAPCLTLTRLFIGGE